VVPCRFERDRGGSVGHGEHRHLGTLQVLLDDDGASRISEPAPEAGIDPVVRLPGIPGHQYPLARGETVGLDHVRSGAVVEVGMGRSRVGEDAGGGSGYTGAVHHLLGEGLGGLEAGGAPLRAERGDAGVTQGVDHPRRQGSLGTDDDEIDPFGEGGGGHRHRIGDREVGERPAQPAQPGVPGGGEEGR
jgi:hypothetical protein